jgi:hypothetical protein
VHVGMAYYVHYSLAGQPKAIFEVGESGKETHHMKYLLAWGLGVPGIVIVIWFLMSHH